MAADMTNDELNEAVALAGDYEQKGWCPKEWATSVDTCLDDLLPAVKKVWPEGKWGHNQKADGRWEACFILQETIGAHHAHAVAPTLARAICLVFLNVMKAHREAA